MLLGAEIISAYIFIHPASLCLLVGALNSFTHKVINNMYDPFTILTFLCLFSVGLFLVLCFMLREVPLTLFVTKLVLRGLTFAFLGSF